MKMSSLFGAVALSSFSLAGCVTQSGYQALENGYGYSEQSVENETYRITYRGNDRTSVAQVGEYLLLRMSEVASEAGADQFTVVKQETDCITTLQSSPTSTCTYRQATDVMIPYFVKDLDKPWFRRLSPTREYEAIAFIVLGFGADGECRTNPDCYETQTVLNRLQKPSED